MKLRTDRTLLLTFSLCAYLAAPMWARGQSASEPPPPADEAAYTFGLNMGQQLHQSGVTNELSVDRVIEGLKAGLAGNKASPADQLQLQAFLRSVLEAAAAKNAAAAKEFLERNGREKGVKTTSSGLQYKIIAAGNISAPSPQPTDRVTVIYRATLVDGTEVDSSSKHPAAAPFAVNNAIRGWQQALGLMKPGAKWRLFVPPELGYGEAGRPGIPGGSLLIYDLELLSAQPAPVPKTP